MGALSTLWYLALAATSKNILADSVEALGLVIAFYYSLTGFACVWYYRPRLLTSPRSFLLIGVAPLAGAAALAYVFAKSVINLATPSTAAAARCSVSVRPSRSRSADFYSGSY
jgi:hypothetical protein